MSFDIYCYSLLYKFLKKGKKQQLKSMLSRCLKTTMESKFRMSTGISLKQDGPWNQMDFFAGTVLTLGTPKVVFSPLVSLLWLTTSP